MKVEKILVAIRMANGDREAWARIARDFGHELPRNRLEILREFRVKASMLGSRLDEKEQFALQFLLDLVAAYEVEIESKLYIQEAVALVQAEGWSSVLRHLRHKPMRASQIVREFSLTDETAPKMFSGMISAGFVYSSQATDPLYSLTALGDQLAMCLTD